MHILLFYSLLILSFIRFIGLGISIDLYVTNKYVRYQYLLIGWSTWFLSGLFPIVLDLITDQNLRQFLLVINSELILLGLVYIMAWSLSYYKPISIKYLIILTLIILLMPLILFFLLGYDPTLKLNSALFLGLFFIIFISVLKNRERLKVVTGSALGWLYVTLGFGLMYIINAFITTLEGYSFGVYQTDTSMVIIRYYFFVIGATALIVTLLIKWEQSVSEVQKFKLKDTYSHNVGNILQIILNNLEAIELTEEHDKKILETTKQKCLEAGELIESIRKI